MSLSEVTTTLEAGLEATKLCQLTLSTSRSSVTITRQSCLVQRPSTCRRPWSGFQTIMSLWLTSHPKLASLGRTLEVAMVGETRNKSSHRKSWESLIVNTIRAWGNRTSLIRQVSKTRCKRLTMMTRSHKRAHPKSQARKTKTTLVISH